MCDYLTWSEKGMLTLYTLKQIVSKMRLAQICDSKKGTPNPLWLFVGMISLLYLNNTLDFFCALTPNLFTQSESKLFQYFIVKSFRNLQYMYSFPISMVSTIRFSQCILTILMKCLDKFFFINN